MTKLCKYNSSKYKLELWDTAGQEKYRSLIKGYLRGANACVFVYDQSSKDRLNLDPSTFTSLIDWIKTFEEVSKDEQTYAILFGNKTDLVPVKTAELIKTKKEAIKTCPKMGEMTEMEGSAKDGRNIAQVFEEIL